MPGGRPRKYGPKVLEILKDYIEDCSKYGDVFPSIAGAAVAMGVCRDTMHAWARDDDKEEYSYMYEQLLAKQEQCCLNGGITGDYNSTIAKLVLSKHGYHDSVKSESKNENKNYNFEAKEMTDEELEAIISDG